MKCSRCKKELTEEEVRICNKCKSEIGAYMKGEVNE